MTVSGHSFFFQAEDGIRAGTVTGVQTCALPILTLSGGNGRSLVPSNQIDSGSWKVDGTGNSIEFAAGSFDNLQPGGSNGRSEERRVGKECRCRCWRVN